MQVGRDLTGHETKPPHPGEILREELLPRLGITAAELAEHLGVPTRKLDAILDERRGIKLDLAQRLGVALGTGARYWLALQMQHDVWMAERMAPVSIAPIVPARRRPAVASAP
ncbi:MAG: HigA family addiction module antitoxin [Hyphomicrobiaceae bacterium]